MSPLIKQFLQKQKVECELKAKKMNALELSIHDDQNHKKEMIQYFGFTEKTLIERKKYLEANV